jgi:hypothetical protein
MKLLLLPLALAATAALLWHSATPAQACSCNSPSTIDDAVARADAVVAAIIGHLSSEVREVKDGSTTLVILDWSAFVTVDRYYKGGGGERIPVTSGPWGAPCGFIDPALEGSRAMLFLRRETGTFITSPCLEPSTAFGHQGQVTEQQIRAVTGPGVPPQTNNVPTIPLAIAAITLPLVFVLVASFVFPAKGSRP